MLTATAYQQFELAESTMRLQIARAMPQFRKVVAHLMDETPGTLSEMIFELLARAYDNFSGSGRSGSADIGNKIRNGEIALVADASNHSNFRRCDRAHNNFFVEGPQILERAASARDDDYFHGFHAIEMLERGYNFTRCEITLNLHRVQHHMRVRKSPLQNAENVHDGGTSGRGHHTDATRQHGQRLFSFLAEKTLFGEMLLQLFKSKLQRARTDGLDVAHVNLILAARLIDT